MSCKRTALICAVLLCVFAVTPSVLFPQTSTSGVVTGTITDPSGASVPSATVTLEQRATGAKLTATVSNTGYYVFTSVAPGDYTLSIEAKGFRKSVFNNLTVEVAKSRTVDVKLELGVRGTAGPLNGVEGERLYSGGKAAPRANCCRAGKPAWEPNERIG